MLQGAGQTQAQLGNRAAARRHLERAIEMFTARRGPDHPRIVGARAARPPWALQAAPEPRPNGAIRGAGQHDLTRVNANIDRSRQDPQRVAGICTGITFVMPS